MSLNVDFDKLDRKKFNSKEFVFVTEDGKTAECFEEIGKDFWIDYVYIKEVHVRYYKDWSQPHYIADMNFVSLHP